MTALRLGRVSAGAAGTRYRMPLRLASRLALAPATAITLLCFCVFVAWTFVISLTSSRLLPVYSFVGFSQYRRIFANARWWTAMGNLAVYAMCLIGGCILAGYCLAILIERSTRWQRFCRVVFLLPLSMSFVATGVIWQWLLNPGLGIQHAVRALGWNGFEFDWLVRPERALYTIAIAGIWQQAGLCMALFLAALHGIDPNIRRISRLDGVPGWRVYLHVVTPMLRPTFLTATVLLFSTAAKSFDLVVTLTGGGPGFASDLPARFIVELINRQELGMGAAGACMLLCTVAAVVGPYLYYEVQRQRHL
jgi:glucose/mannose transport system permease protein